jgi:hypothetical protein
MTGFARGAGMKSQFTSLQPRWTSLAMLCLAACALCCALAAAALGEDWTQWRGGRRDGGHSRKDEG